MPERNTDQMELNKLASKFKSLRYLKERALPEIDDTSLKQKMAETIDEYGSMLKELMVASRALPKDQEKFEQLQRDLVDLERTLSDLENESRLSARV